MHVHVHVCVRYTVPACSYLHDCIHLCRYVVHVHVHVGEFTSAASAQLKDQWKEMVWERWRLERNTILLTGEKRGREPRERYSVESAASWPGGETGRPLLVDWGGRVVHCYICIVQALFTVIRTQPTELPRYLTCLKHLASYIFVLVSTTQNVVCSHPRQLSFL